VTEITILF